MVWNVKHDGEEVRRVSGDDGKIDRVVSEYGRVLWTVSYGGRVFSVACDDGSGCRDLGDGRLVW